MKKITLLIVLIAIPFIGFAQIFDFTNSDDGWNTLVRFTSTNNATFMKITTVAGDGSLKNPSVENAMSSPTIDADTQKWIGITLKNNDATGPTYLRVAFRKSDDSGWVQKNTVITTADTQFKTYWIDLTNSNWTGIKDRFRLQFKTDNGTSSGANYILPNASISIDIDKIEFTASAPTTEQHIYEFNTDGDTEGWVKANGTISGPAAGSLTFTPTANKFAKIKQEGHHVDANTFARMHIRLKNLSTNDDQIRVIMNGDAVNVVDQIITTGDANFKTYDLDLSSSTAWTGNVLVQIGFRDQDNANNPGQSSGTGDFVIDRIEFSNAVLSVRRNELTDFTLYPNPVNNRLNFNSLTDISKIEVYNLTGQRLLQLRNFSNNSFDVSTLSSGIYLVNVEDVENRSVTKKIIINK